MAESPREVDKTQGEGWQKFTGRDRRLFSNLAVVQFQLFFFTDCVKTVDEWLDPIANIKDLKYVGHRDSKIKFLDRVDATSNLNVEDYLDKL